MAKEVFFFFTKKDIINVIENVEQILSLKYVEAKSYSSDKANEYVSLVEYKKLGINKSGDHQTESFLVVDEAYKIVKREVRQFDGSTKYFVNQMNNEESILLWPGGIFDNKYLICGHIGTVYQNEKSKQIFNAFQKAIKNQCKTKVGRYYLGKEAEKLNKKMRFITINVNEPIEFDVQI